MGTISSLNRLTRPLSNVKNAAMIFFAWYVSGWKPDLSGAVLGFLSLSFICSAVYALNTCSDYKIDSKNPNKRHFSDSIRYLGKKRAILAMILLICAGALIGSFINLRFLAASLSVLIVGLLYSSPPARFKERAVLDVVFGAALTLPLRFIAAWYIFSSSIPPLLIVLALAFAKSGGYLLYKTLDREHLKKLKIKNTADLLSRRASIIISLVLISLSLLSFAFLCLNSIYNIPDLGSLSFRLLYLLPLISIPITIVILQILKITKFENKLLRILGLIYFALMLILAWKLI